MRYCLPLVCSLVLTGLPASPVAAAEPLRLYTWEGYFSDTLLQRWAISTAATCATPPWRAATPISTWW